MKSILRTLVLAFVVLFVILYIWIESGSRQYREIDAKWEVTGYCLNASTGNPVPKADVTAEFIEPITFKHRFYNTQLRSSIIKLLSDDQGRFVATGQGGSVSINVQALGFVEGPDNYWNHNNVNGSDRVETTITLHLEPM